MCENYIDKKLTEEQSINLFKFAMELSKDTRPLTKNEEELHKKATEKDPIADMNKGMWD